MSDHSKPRRWTLETTPSAMDGETHCVRAVGPELVGSEEPSVREDRITEADVEGVKAWLFSELGDDYADAEAATQDARSLLARIFEGRS